MKLKQKIPILILLLGLLCLTINLTRIQPTARVEALPNAALQSSGLERGSGGGVRSVKSASPFAPSEASTLQGVAFHTGAYPPSGTCGRCHVSIHSNWESSLHRLAASDPWYLKVKDLVAFEEGEVAVRQCAGCHAPVALMTGEVGLYSRESVGSLEGVSCVFCHTLDRVEGGNARYLSDPGRIRPYPGGDYLSVQEIEAAAHLVMADPQQHREDMMRPFYRTSAFCQGCHELTMNGVRLQSTFSEWAQSSYAEQGVTCQGCHFTPGAGETRERGRLVDHRPVERDRVYRHTLGGGSLTVAARDNRTELKEAVALEAAWQGERLRVTVRNVKGGHAIPTGVSDLRELWLEITAMDANGREVFTSGHLDAAGRIREGSTIFHTVFGDEHGNKIVRHDIWRARQILKDTRIPADGQRQVSYRLPGSAKDVKVRLLWRDAPADFQQIVVQGATQPAEVFSLAEWRQQR